MAVVRGTEVVSSMVGRRHVQGKTKAGGQSQQRFARRRDNQARQAYETVKREKGRVDVVFANAGGAEFVPMATLCHDTLCATFSGLSKIYRACGYRVGWVSFSGDRSTAGDYLLGLDLLASQPAPPVAGATVPPT